MFSRAATPAEGQSVLRRRGARVADVGGKDPPALEEAEFGGEEENEEEDAGGGGGGVSGREAPQDAEVEQWDECFLCPLRVRFTQDKVHPFFYRRGPIVNVVPKIRPVLREAGTWVGGSDDEEVVELVPPFSPIQCLRKGEDIWSLDNRRLYALQMAALEHWPRRCRVRVLCRDRLSRHKFKSQYRKFNTTSEGRIVSIAARYQQFDTWSWFERAVDTEWYHFSQHLGTILSCFEVLPVVGALLFRTGITGFASRVPFVVGFALSFAADILRQKVPVLERRLCEYQVLAVLNGEVRPISQCCSRLLQEVRRIRGVEEESGSGPMSAPQLTATSALLVLLVLPYLLAISHERLRSSAMSCWLGVACVLLFQLLSTLRTLTSAANVAAMASLAGPAPAADAARGLSGGGRGPWAKGEAERESEGEAEAEAEGESNKEPEPGLKAG
mmetsp:Transcript_63127/g.178353  ORF Transcript_63127/g.178353 Transcript_63127/m.178353 type:complete len:443 (-) Transcript_63127:96-1424(-)